MGSRLKGLQVEHRERILITGGAGFIGARLARDLILSGYDVHLLLRSSSSRWRLDDLQGQFVEHQADLLDSKAVQAAVDAAAPQLIYHLATHGVYSHQKNRAQILNANIMGTAHLLDALSAHDYRMLVNLGSAAEYGHQPRATRVDDPLAPCTDYGVAKAAASLLCHSEMLRGKPITTVRVFCCYGPGEEPLRLVPYVMNCCLRGERPKIGAGWQPRDFIYVDDVVQLLKVAAASPQSIGHVLHGAAGQQWTVREMVETILQVCTDGQLQAEFGAVPVREGEPTTWFADIASTTQLTGWTPEIDLLTGITRCWDYYRTTLRRAAA